MREIPGCKLAAYTFATRGHRGTLRPRLLDGGSIPEFWIILTKEKLHEIR